MKTYTTEQITRYLTLKKGKYKIKMIIDEDNRIRIKNYQDDKTFLFENFYSEKTLDKWERVLKLMLEAVKIARSKLPVK